MANEDRRKYLVEINADAAEETTNLIATLPGVVSLTELTYRPSPIKPVQRTLGALIGELVAYERFLKKDTVKQASMSIGIGTEVFVDITKGKHPDIGYNRMARIAEYLGLEQAQITDLVENISAQREQIETQMGYKLMLDQRHDGAGGKHASDRDFTRSFRLNPNSPPLEGTQILPIDLRMAYSSCAELTYGI